MMMRAAARRKTRHGPMPEVTSAARVQVSGWVSQDHSRGCHFRQKILEPPARRRLRHRYTERWRRQPRDRPMHLLPKRRPMGQSAGARYHFRQRRDLRKSCSSVALQPRGGHLRWTPVNAFTHSFVVSCKLAGATLAAPRPMAGSYAGFACASNRRRAGAAHSFSLH